ncbi:hypothetical protein C2G38_2081243 [Gigaspora rosea]|uniref:Uncharacterized protein n=1 Tax=Gigaspora rosea TaxID=44941 RepID=A0A397VK50_9GLOM|nr:hypothetical protein C2G38_2081243 [Gigaspora rosea]
MYKIYYAAEQISSIYNIIYFLFCSISTVLETRLMQYTYNVKSAAINLYALRSP